MGKFSSSRITDETLVNLHPFCSKMHLKIISFLSLLAFANCFPTGTDIVEQLGEPLDDFRLPSHVHDRSPSPNAFADPNGLERFQNVHNNHERQQVYFSTVDPSGSYYTMKAHHRPVTVSRRQYRQYY